MKITLLLFLTILHLNGYSQIIFEKGYYIDNSDQRVNCLIKNIDWVNNPTEFSFKLSENGDVQGVGIESVKEFGIYDFSKYVRHTVKIDRSSDEIDELDVNRKPEFEEETLFLKPLIEGEASLYLYKYGNLNRFFYSKGESGMTQLVYKRYKKSERLIGSNNQFKQQLLNHLKCSKISQNRIERLDYKIKELVKLFSDYNECNNSDYINYLERNVSGAFNLNLRPGLNYSNFSVSPEDSNAFEADFNSELSFRFGIEAEFILPFNKSKWGIILEPSFQYFKSSTQNAEADFKSFDMPFGIRHYFFLRDDSKIFINATYNFNKAINSTIKYNTLGEFELKAEGTFAVGLGYKKSDRYSLEARLVAPSELLRTYVPHLNSNYNTVSVIFGYSLLKGNN